MSRLPGCCALWLALASGLMLTASAAQAAAETASAELTALTGIVEASLQQEPVDVEARLRASLRLLELLASRDQGRALLASKARYSACRGLLRLARRDECKPLLARLLVDLNPGVEPDLYLRVQDLDASLRFLANDLKGAGERYERALAGSLDGVSIRTRLIARANYALLLYDTGDLVAAVETYETTVGEALEAGLLTESIGVAANLIELLMLQGRTAQALTWQARMEPVRRRVDRSAYRAVFDVAVLRLQVRRGEPGPAVAPLRALTASGNPVAPVVRGRGLTGLAEAQLALGDARQAIDLARQAQTVLSAWPKDRWEASMVLARAQLALGLPDEALQTLAEQSDKPAPGNVHAADAVALRLRALIERGALDDGKALVPDLSETLAQVLARSSLESTSYYDTRLAGMRGEAALDTARQAQGVEAARLVSARALARSELLRRNLLLAALAVLAVLLLAYSHTQSQRRFESRLREQELALQASLQERMQEATRQLSAAVAQEASMREAVDRKRHLETVGRITGSVAHDFNNFLQVLLASNELFEKSSLSEAGRQALAQSKEACERSASIVRQLLAYSSRQKLTPEAVNVQGYLSEHAALFRTALGEAVRLEVIDRSAPSVLMVDPAALTSALLALLANAAEALPQGGAVCLTARLTQGELAGAVPSGVAERQFLDLELRDDGVGMSAAVLAQAPEPFFSTKDSRTGFGLGLSSARGFAHQSGGELLLDSESGAGTRVTLRVPVLSHDPELAQADAGAAGPVAGKRLLLVEDNALVAGLLAPVLEMAAVTVCHVSSAAEAIEILNAPDSPSFDCLLTDVKMPGAMDGAALAVQVQATHPHMRVLLMSGYDELQASLASVPLLQKPFSGGQLLDFLAEHG